MKNLALIYLPVLLAFLLSITGCSLIKPLELKGINSFEIGENSAIKGIVVTTNLSLHNPNGFKFTVNSADIDVFADGVNLGKLQGPTNIEVGAKSDFSGDFYIELSFAKLLLSGRNLLSKIKSGKIELQLKGSIETEILWINKNFKVNHSEVINL
jgi:LEA14-like dessication related protein